MIAVFGSYAEIISRDSANYIMKYLYYYSYVGDSRDAVIVPFPGAQTCSDGEKRAELCPFCPLLRGRHFSSHIWKNGIKNVRR